MLKGLDPLLHADLLYVLAAMGHGDEIAIVDRNFPAVSSATRTVRLDGVDAPHALAVILTVFPLDDFVDTPAIRMETLSDPEDEPEVCREFREVIDSVEGPRWELGKLDRFAFYERTRTAFAVVITGERRLYGNLLLTKGVIRPPQQ